MLEKRWFDAIYDGEDEVEARFGPVFNEARMRYLSQMGSGSTTRRYFEMYNLMGDPSLPILDIEPPTGLKITGNDFTSSGQRGGPFTPDSIVYTLENKNETELEYEVTTDVTWVDITNATGTLSALGTVDVTISVNDEALELLHGDHTGTITFTNLIDHDGDDIRAMTLTVDDLAARYSFPLNEDPGWSREGAWEFGVPTGAGSHYGDATAAFTGNNVLGYNLEGDYPSNMSEYYLTTSAIDCSDYNNVELRFWRWLGVEKSDRATVEASNDGVNWTQIWANPFSTTVSDSSWSQITLDLSAVAEEQPTVYVRWGMGPTDSTVTYPGWNIDDIQIWGALAEFESLTGDLDGDCDVDLADLATLLASYGTTQGATPEQGDLDGDGDVDLSDLATLLAAYGSSC